MSTTGSNDLPVVLISLMKGIVDREVSLALWQVLMATQARVRDHIAVIGLELVLDDTEGFAYLRQRPQIEGDPELPRLITRRQLSFSVSLALALLRKRLAEFDATSGETRLIVMGDEILDMMRLFLPDTTNQAKLKERVDRDIIRIVDLGFLRPLKCREGTYEVRRILRSFVDAQWLGHLNERLASYAAHAAASDAGQLQSSDGGTGA
jgi:hypothetical protein